MNFIRGVAPYLLPLFVLVPVFAWGRFSLVEPADVVAMCQTQSHGWCEVRQMIIEVFVHQRIGWVALACAMLAIIFRRAWLASAGLATGAVAMLLYAPQFGALALLVSVLVLVRAVRSPRFAGPG